MLLVCMHAYNFFNLIFLSEDTAMQMNAYYS